MRDEYFLSIYADISPIAAAYAIPRRHDQAMALWRRTGNQLALVRYWEFERLTGIKGHALSFPDARAAYAFIAEALAPEGLTLADIRAIIGTPGLSAPGEPAAATPEPPRDVAYHSLCHLYSGLLADSEIFDKGTILCLALDAGPDHVIDQDAWDKPHHLGAFSDQGAITLFPVPSPAILWALMRERCGLAEGTLMALGSASTVRLALDPPPPPEIRSVADRFAALDWLDEVATGIDRLAAEEPGRFRCPDGRFSQDEIRTAALVKVVQAASFTIVARTVEQALERFSVAASRVHLSMVGGFALNCPINGQLMRRFGFRGFIAPPVVNDSGIALGMGLHHAHRTGEGVAFRLGTAFHGRRHNDLDRVLRDSPLAPRVASVETVGPERVVDDILNGPVVWFDGTAEIGPRALGHRSLLADPRRPDHKDRLNRIKGREWWRPVAPIVRAGCARDWFALAGPSPFMLQAVPVHPDRRDRIPAVCHLDGTARVQTLRDEDDPALAAVLRAFHERTGIPMLCNTSLNDKGEPIIDGLERALSFALEKGIEIAYLNGRRIRLAPASAGDRAATGRERPGLRHFTPPALTADWLVRHNPQGLTRRELAACLSDPRLAAYDLTRAKDVRTLRRLLAFAARRRGAAGDVMLAEAGTNGGGLVVD
ncbi:carbamoyltransferase C-terminal domain-containing protein [Azospirillum sp. B2RO_4]|uniref:carbamoyltransferase C-terminal domain-containing protein n=1 Tax=Azospirillum sp. B2RO_4 TaxID=3027796 RepID=UPI003DA86666